MHGRGRFADAHRLLQQGTVLLRQQGLSGFADAITKNASVNLTEAGDREAGIRIFRSVPLDPEDGGDLEGLVDLGDFKAAEADLQAVRSKYPQGTVWQHYFGPRIEAGIALANHHPVQAIALMEATRSFDDRDPGKRRFRGDAYLAAGQPSLAQKEYRAVIAHREIAPESADYPLSWLGLGEALAAEGKSMPISTSLPYGPTPIPMRCISSKPDRNSPLCKRSRWPNKWSRDKTEYISDVDG